MHKNVQLKIIILTRYAVSYRAGIRDYTSNTDLSHRECTRVSLESKSMRIQSLKPYLRGQFVLVFSKFLFPANLGLIKPLVKQISSCRASFHYFWPSETQVRTALLFDFASFARNPTCVGVRYSLFESSARYFRGRTPILTVLNQFETLLGINRLCAPPLEVKASPTLGVRARLTFPSSKRKALVYTC